MKHPLIVFLLLLLTSCSTNNNIPTIDNPNNELINIKQKYIDELANIQVGDYIKKVAKLFPDMYLASKTMKNTQYELDYHQQYFLAANDTSPVQTKTQTLRFYFINKKLVHWGVK
ncbi:MAG: hypothetical protein GY928_10810 [Colwellia sp.]|nr:hypothetical protein [Colwellia sp.]